MTRPTPCASLSYVLVSSPALNPARSLKGFRNELPGTRPDSYPVRFESVAPIKNLPTFCHLPSNSVHGVGGVFFADSEMATTKFAGGFSAGPRLSLNCVGHNSCSHGPPLSSNVGQSFSPFRCTIGVLTLLFRPMPVDAEELQVLLAAQVKLRCSALIALPHLVERLAVHGVEPARTGGCRWWRRKYVAMNDEHLTLFFCA